MRVPQAAVDDSSTPALGRTCEQAHNLFAFSCQFGLQALINMASTVNLMPPKGMTLPFISYGGSSTLALGLGLGMVLALTRLKPDQEVLR